MTLRQHSGRLNGLRQLHDADDPVVIAARVRWAEAKIEHVARMVLADLPPLPLDARERLSRVLFEQATA